MKPIYQRHLFIIGLYGLLVIKFFAWNWNFLEAILSLTDPIFLIPAILYFLGFVLHHLLASPFSKKIETTSLVIFGLTMTLFMILTPKLDSFWAYFVYGLSVLGSFFIDYGIYRTMINKKNEAPF